MKNLPERIYLNIGDEVPADVDFRELSEVTWSEEKMSDNDIAFTRKLQWISVAEELPSNDHDVVASDENGLHIASYFNGEWYSCDDEFTRNPQIWMPIPSLPDPNTEKK